MFSNSVHPLVPWVKSPFQLQMWFFPLMDKWVGSHVKLWDPLVIHAILEHLWRDVACMLVQKYKNKDHPAVTAANYTARKDLKTARKWHTHTHTHTHNHFTALWILSRTTRVSWYQKKHSPTHTYRGHQSSLICFIHLLRSMASSLFNLAPSTSYCIHFFTQSLSSFHFILMLEVNTRLKYELGLWTVTLVLDNDFNKVSHNRLGAKLRSHNWVVISLTDVWNLGSNICQEKFLACI